LTIGFILVALPCSISFLQDFPEQRIGNWNQTETGIKQDIVTEKQSGLEINLSPYLVIGAA